MSNRNVDEKSTTQVVDKPLPGLAGTVPPPPPEPLSLKTLLRGDLGFIPVLLTLIVIAIYFQISPGSPEASGLFLSSKNISNLAQQIVPTGILGIAAALVLLLGEIDLSLAATAFFASAVMSVLSVYQDWPAWAAILGGLVAGAIIGFINGVFIAVLRVPSFIVTLAGSIAYSGLLLLVLGRQSTLIVRDDFIRGLAPTFLPAWAGVGIPVLVVVVYIAATLLEQRRRAAIGLKTRPPAQLGAQLAIVAVVVLAGVLLLQSNEGVPQGLLIWFGLIVILWLVLTKTAWGRHLYAVGGSSEGARRAGINVVSMKIAVFVLASTLAAFSGIMLVSRSTAVATAIPPTLLLNAIAAAVIGGVSLFGGRGSVWAVVLGSLVIYSLENGLTLQSQEQSVKNVVQGVVLILAVTLDALVRRANSKQGR